jgi:hypothetical protein
MGISHNLIILFCILGAAALVLVGFAFQRLFGKGDAETPFNQQLPQQEAYMRDVRMRNQRWAFAEARPSRYPPPSEM